MKLQAALCFLGSKVMKYYHKDQYVNHVVPYTQSPCPRNMVLISVSISKKLLLDAACGEHCDPGPQGAQLIFKPLTCRMPFYALLAPNSTFLPLSSITLVFGSYSLWGHCPSYSACLDFFLWDKSASTQWEHFSSCAELRLVNKAQN